MKLLFDATELSYYNEKSGHRAGVFYVALNLLREFQARNIDITFICDYRRVEFLKRVDEFNNIHILDEFSIINKFWGWLMYLTRNFPTRIKYALLILSRFYDSYCYKLSKKNLRQINNFDVYFSPFTPPVKEIELSDLKRFRMIHDVIPILEKGMPKSPKDWYYKIYKAINDKDFYFANSENTKKDVLKYFSFVKESNIKTTLLGASEKFVKAEANSPVNDKYIFSLCTLGKRKNLEFAIRNFFEFVNKNNINDLKLVIGGSVWKKFEKELNKILDKCDCSKIILTGYIEEAELARYYSNALCFIYPSLYEGFGLPVLEAMQTGCPVITSNVSSLPEVIGDCGIQINPESDEELISAYEKMYFDEKFRTECSQKGLKKAADFSWGKCAEEILEFIKENTLSK